MVQTDATDLEAEFRGRKPGDPPMDINIACPLIWKHHRDCCHDCGCAGEFIDYLAFDAVCKRRRIRSAPVIKSWIGGFLAPASSI